MLHKGLTGIAVSLVLSAMACAAGPGAEPVAPPSFGSNGYAWPPKTTSRAATGWRAPAAAKLDVWAASPSGPNSAGPVDVLRGPARHPAEVSGDGCIEALGRAGVTFDEVDSVRGVDTPVVVTSPMGQVRYFANGNVPLLLDCRMALTLANIAPLLREHGVSEVRFSGAYVYRMSSKGRLSLHARGLALDVHELTVAGQKLSVESAFARGLGDDCTSNFPALNRIACSLKSSGVFRELLTPDYDADHHDHFHLAIAALTPDA